MIPLYLRREPTTDYVLLGFHPDGAGKRDVVAYSDEAATQIKVRWPWYFESKPRKGRKYVTFNCYRWAAIWLDYPARGGSPPPPPQGHSRAFREALEALQ